MKVNNYESETASAHWQKKINKINLKGKKNSFANNKHIYYVIN